MAFDAGSLIQGRELSLALSGKLQKYLDGADMAILRAASVAVNNVTQNTKDGLRQMVTGARLGKRLANAVRAKVYPERGLGRNPAGWIFVQQSAVHIFKAFEENTTIRAGGGKNLAIPIPGSPADRKNFGQQRSGETIIQSIRNRGIELSYVPGRNGRPAMLVAQSVRLGVSKAGRQRVTSAKRTKSGGFAKNASSIPLFWLVPEANIKKRLDWGREFQRASSEFMSRFTAEFEKQLAVWEKSL